MILSAEKLQHKEQLESLKGMFCLKEAEVWQGLGNAAMSRLALVSLLRIQGFKVLKSRKVVNAFLRIFVQMARWDTQHTKPALETFLELLCYDKSGRRVPQSHLNELVLDFKLPLLMCQHQEHLRNNDITGAIDREVQLQKHLDECRSSDSFSAVNLLLL